MSDRFVITEAQFQEISRVSDRVAELFNIAERLDASLGVLIGRTGPDGWAPVVTVREKVRQIRTKAKKAL